MRIGDSINTFLTAAIAVGCIYALWTWQFDESKNGDNSEYAESACVDEINASFAVNAVNVYAVEETARGFVVRASVTMSKGTSARIYCVTNEFGRVEDVRVLER
jgi:hypothetical protein